MYISHTKTTSKKVKKGGINDLVREERKLNEKDFSVKTREGRERMKDKNVCKK